MSHRVESIDQLLRGRRVRVESHQGQRFEGYLERVWYPQRHVLLRDVQELPGGVRSASAFVAGVDWIVPVTNDVHIAEVPVDAVAPCKYAVAEFEADENSRRIDRAARRGTLERFPVITAAEEGYTLVGNHSGLWIASQAGLDTIPMNIEELTGAEIACRFAFDHFPLPHELKRTRRPWGYPDAAIAASIEVMLEGLGGTALDICPVRFNAERLEVETVASIDLT